MSEELLAHCKKTLRSCLLTEKYGLKISFVEKDYYNISGERFPHREFGFRDAAEFIMAKMSDTAKRTKNPDGEDVFAAVADASTAHISDLVKKQRSKKRPPKRGGFAFSTGRQFHSNNNNSSYGGRRPAGDNANSYSSFRSTTVSNRSRGSSRRPAYVPPSKPAPSSFSSISNHRANPPPMSTTSRYSRPAPTNNSFTQGSANQRGGYREIKFVKAKEQDSFSTVVDARAIIESRRAAQSQVPSLFETDLSKVYEKGSVVENSHHNQQPLVRQQNANQQYGYRQHGNQQFVNQQHGNQQHGNQQFVNQQHGNQQHGNQQHVNHQHENLQHGNQPPMKQQHGSAFGSNSSGPAAGELSSVDLRAQLREQHAQRRAAEVGSSDVHKKEMYELPPRFRKDNSQPQNSSSGNSGVPSHAGTGFSAVTQAASAPAPAPTGVNNSQKDVIEKVLSILKNKPAGIWAPALCTEYKNQYTVDSPSNLLEILQYSSDIVLETIGTRMLVLPKLEPCDVTVVNNPPSSTQSTTSGVSAVTSTSNSVSTVTSTPTSAVITSQQKPPVGEGPFNVFISYVSSTDDIVLRLIGPQYSDALDDLEKRLLTCKGPLCNNPSPGMYCVYLSHNKEAGVTMAYRTLIHQYDDGKLYGEFLDHGDYDDLELDCVYELPSQHNSLPYQGIHCRLTGLECFADDDRGLDLLDKHALSESCKARFDQREPEVSVTLWNENSILNDELSNALLTPHLRATGEMTSAYVSYIDEAGSVYLNIQSVGYDRLEELSEALQLSVKRATKSDRLDEKPEVGTMCLALATSSNAWSRAEVIEYTPDTRQILVQYIDYGDAEYVSMDSVYKISVAGEQLAKLPHQAVQCQLRDLPPMNTSWTDDGKDLLAQLVPPGVPVTVITISTGSAGSCSSSDNNESSSDDVPIIDIITEHGLSVCDILGQYTEIWARVESGDVVVDNLAEDLMTQVVVSQEARPVPHPATDDLVYITWATDPYNFRAIPHQYLQELDDLSKKLQTYFQENCHIVSPRMEEIDHKQLYAGRHGGLWYRVKIVNALPAQVGSSMVCNPLITHSAPLRLTHSYRVLFVDYGDATAMSLTDIHRLPQKFLSLPMLAINMKLAVELPEGETEWSEEVSQSFCDSCLEGTFRIKVISSESNLMTVLLYDCESNQLLHESFL